MVFAHDTEANLTAAVDLVNTAGDPDGLRTLADLDEFLAHYGFTGRRDRTAADLDEIRTLRPALRELLLSPRDEAVAITNRWLAGARAVPQLVRHNDVDWHVHAIADDRPLAQRIQVETAMAMIDVIRADETSRLGECADESCDGLVFDLSRNRSRRFCSTTCGNRNAAAAYRARRRA